MRMRNTHRLGLLLPFVLLSLAIPSPVRAEKIGAEEVMKRAYLAEYYPGDDMKAKVLMRLVSGDGKERIREMEYRYAAAHLGAEVGVVHQRQVALQCHGRGGEGRLLPGRLFTSFLSGMSCCWNCRAVQAFSAHSTAYPAR